MSTSEDFPMPTRMHPLEVARLLYEKEKELENQNSRSEETKPPRFSGACTYLTRNEAAEYLRIGRSLLDHHPKGIPFYKICGRVLYIKEELDEIIRRSGQGGES